jgi:sec-independent protein translocase protein TatB
MRNSPRSRRRATPQSTGAPDLFEGRFSEILIIFVLALIVLGPEKLPRLVSELGRWAGRARAMARQFREQLEEEVELEAARKAHRSAAPADPRVAPAAPAANHSLPAADPAPAAPAPDPSLPAADPEPAAPAANPSLPAADPTPAAPADESSPVTATFSHAHVTDASGADPSESRAGAGPSADERGT